MYHQEEEQLLGALRAQARGARNSAAQARDYEEVRAIAAAVLEVAGGRNRPTQPDAALEELNASMAVRGEGEWLAFFDRDQGMTYYFNEDSGEVTWTNPAAPLEGTAFAKHGRDSMH